MFLELVWIPGRWRRLSRLAEQDRMAGGTGCCLENITGQSGDNSLSFPLHFPFKSLSKFISAPRGREISLHLCKAHLFTCTLPHLVLPETFPYHSLSCFPMYLLTSSPSFSLQVSTDVSFLKTSI